MGTNCDSLSVGITAIAQEHDYLQVYPNPAHDFFWIQYNLPIYFNGDLEIYDVSGQLQQKFCLYGQSKTLLVHADKLSNGLYYFLLKMGGRRIQEGKIIIIK